MKNILPKILKLRWFYLTVSLLLLVTAIIAWRLGVSRRVDWGSRDEVQTAKVRIFPILRGEQTAEFELTGEDARKLFDLLADSRPTGSGGGEERIWVEITYANKKKEPFTMMGRKYLYARDTYFRADDNHFEMVMEWLLAHPQQGASSKPTSP